MEVSSWSQNLGVNPPLYEPGFKNNFLLAFKWLWVLDILGRFQENVFDFDVISSRIF